MEIARSGQELDVGRVLKYLFFLVVAGAIGLSGYALFSDLSAPKSEVVKTIDLNRSQ